ncbi:Fc.00g073180.m01.CDS01 [Cosmosporella sp. VM-42]
MTPNHDADAATRQLWEYEIYTSQEEELIAHLRSAECAGVLLDEISNEVPLSPSIFPLDYLGTDRNGKLTYSRGNETRLYITLLGQAAARGLNEAVLFLLDYGCNIDSTPEEGGSIALFLALYYGHAETARLLLEKGARPYASYGYNALHAAARQGFEDIMTMLVLGDSYGVDPNGEDIDGAVPIMYALLLPPEKALSTISHLRRLGAQTDFLICVGNIHWRLDEIARVMGLAECTSIEWLIEKTGGNYIRTRFMPTINAAYACALILRQG